MTIDCTTRLDEARAAYHQLMTGRRTASIGIGARRAYFSTAPWSVYASVGARFA